MLFMMLARLLFENTQKNSYNTGWNCSAWVYQLSSANVVLLDLDDVVGLLKSTTNDVITKCTAHPIKIVWHRISSLQLIKRGIYPSWCLFECHSEPVFNRIEYSGDPLKFSTNRPSSFAVTAYAPFQSTDGIASIVESAPNQLA